MKLSPLTTIICFLIGHKLQIAAHRHNGIHFICPRCGMYLWRPMDTEGGKFAHIKDGE